MFELDHDLAQDIVDRAMAILPYNVNVMDSQGLILGSGEPERINTRHEGAQLVLANGRVVEIDAQTAVHLKGVQPGINLPLLLDQRLIGVLGITGEPEQLRTYAELVRMTAEMLVGQRNQQAEQQWRRQRCDDLLALLLSEAGDSPRLIDEAQQLGLKPQLTRVPYLFELGLEHGPGQTVEALSAWLTSRYPDSWCVSSAKSSLLWCRPASQNVEHDRLLEKLDGLGWNILRIAVGGQADGLVGLRRCYRRVGDLAGLWPRGAAALAFADAQSLSAAGDAVAASQRRCAGRIAQTAAQGHRQGRQRPVAGDAAQLVRARRAESGVCRCAGDSSQQFALSDGADCRAEWG